MILANDEVGHDTIIHEMTHAHNDLILGGGLDDRTDEGMAYAMQSFYQLTLLLAANEKLTQKQGCDYRFIHGWWQNFWKMYGHMPSDPGWGTGRTNGRLGGGKFDVDRNDFNNIKKAFGLNLSCKEIAAVINQILQDKKCCFRVTCSGETFPCQDDCWGQISAGFAIDSIFQ